MRDATAGALSDQLAGLFGAGTCAGLSDGELLERFRTGRGEGAERAFEALAARHGPLVLGTCRNLLDDPSDVHDAFQAVFLVLARRAGAIRKSQSLGSWLYGVTIRVAARARAKAIRRRERERRILASAAARAGSHPEAGASTAVESDEGAAVVHEEVIRLPERYRTPIVLCYFEGLTHDEAAARLSWPVGTVRSRLARARDRLRTRLTRRGVTAPATIGASAWFLAAPDATAASLSPVPVSLARDAVRLAMRPTSAVEACSAASIALSEGVLHTMLLKKLTMAACAIASIGIGGGVGAALVRGARAQTQAPTTPTPAARTTADRETLLPKLPGLSPILAELLDAARERYRLQWAFYAEGRTTVDRIIGASLRMMNVELLAATNDDQRTAIRRRHLDRAKEIEHREKTALSAGRGTAADLAEARQARLEAEFQAGTISEQDAEKRAILRRIADLERKVEQLQQERDARNRSREDVRGARD